MSGTGQRVLGIMIMCVLPGAAHAANTQWSGVTFSVSGSPPGGVMIQSIGDTTNQLVDLIMGPGMYLVMAIGAVLALYGWARGNKESLWTGLTLFVLAAVLRSVFSVL